ncbi:hypothetical protein BGZ49_010014 [Haplosporangium sp. Z 27]|nr:hypothetical protein BGZ49_010014 [Haplosporangium sp. Z 27]
MPYSPSPDRYHDRRGAPRDWDAPEEEEGEISYPGSGRHRSSSRGGGAGSSTGRDHRDRDRGGGSSGYSDRRRDDRYRDGGSDRRDYRDRGDRSERDHRDYRDRSDRDGGRRRRSSRSRSRSRSPYGRRSGGGRSRSRSPVRSKKGYRDEGDDKEDGEFRNNTNNNDNKNKKGSDKKANGGKGDTEMTASEELSPEDEEARMMALMGFGGFDSTKGKKVPGADVSGADIKKQRQYRQYMNRRGGFNRPLDAK